MLHHVLLEVTDLSASAGFYDALLAPLGWRRHGNDSDVIGYGISRPWLFIAPGGDEASTGSVMVSFGAPGIAAVKASWEAGVAAGGVSAADPGETKGPGSGSFSAFLRDPDGHEVEITVGSD